MRLLLVEDSYMLADTLASTFQKEHYIVDIAYDGEQGYEYASSGIYDVAVLDLMLPKMSGYEVLRKLREEGNALPILILSAKCELDDKIQAFEYGADDYLTKPFEAKELLMRLRAITRRRGAVELSSLSCGNLRLNLNNCEITNCDTAQSVKLGGKEFQLLEYLLRNQNQVMTREQIIQKIWGYDTNTEYNNVEVYVSFLRKKMTFIASNTRIRAVRGVGYSLEVEE